MMLRKTAITLAAVLILSAPAFSAQQITEEDKKKVDAIFDLTDSDSNDSLSKTEWEEASKVTFEIIDLNKDGNISRDEYHKTPETMQAKFKEGEKAGKK